MVTPGVRQHGTRAGSDRPPSRTPVMASHGVSLFGTLRPVPSHLVRAVTPRSRRRAPSCARCHTPRALSHISCDRRSPAAAGATVTPGVRQHGTCAGAAGAEPPAHTDRVVTPAGATRTPFALSHIPLDRRTRCDGCDGDARCAATRKARGAEPHALAYADHGVGPRARCRTPLAPLHPVRAVAPRPRRRTPSGGRRRVAPRACCRASSVTDAVVVQGATVLPGVRLRGRRAGSDRPPSRAPLAALAARPPVRRSWRRSPLAPSHIPCDRRTCWNECDGRAGHAAPWTARGGEPLRPAHADHALTPASPTITATSRRRLRRRGVRRGRCRSTSGCPRGRGSRSRGSRSRCRAARRSPPRPRRACVRTGRPARR